jgi:hypothetical protein
VPIDAGTSEQKRLALVVDKTSPKVVSRASSKAPARSSAGRRAKRH